MKPTVLLLSTYPLCEPKNGGQLRLFNIGNAFAKAGWRVESMAIYTPEAYGFDRIGWRDIAFPAASPYRKFHGRTVPLINDLLAGKYATQDPRGFQKVLKKLPRQIDAIHVEQPWLWPLACRIKQIPRYMHTCLIYGSANVEAPLKQAILATYNVAHSDEIVAEIDALEQQAAREADMAVAVTQADLEVLEKWGARRLLLAPNGISPWCASPARLLRWRAELPKSPWIFYVASGHPPNFTEFTQCVGESLGCIPPDSKLVIAGGVSKPLQDSLAATRWGALNLSRLQLLYALPDEDLAAVKTLAHAFLLPIPYGGGSNIKTAEALYSGAYVIGSESAFRGFEGLMHLPEVRVAHSASQCQLMIREVLACPPARSWENELGRHLRKRLQWDVCLAPLPAAVTAFQRNSV